MSVSILLRAPDQPRDSGPRNTTNLTFVFVFIFSLLADELPLAEEPPGAARQRVQQARDRHDELPAPAPAQEAALHLAPCTRLLGSTWPGGLLGSTWPGG